LWANTTFRHVLLCFSVIHFFGSGIGLWQPSFFARSFGLKTGVIGTWFALIWGLGGFVGTYGGGVLASRYAANNERLQLRAMAAIYCIFGIVSMFIYLARNPFVAFGFMGLAAVGIGTTYGTLFATIQTLVPEHMRAMAVAGIFLFANLVGQGLGPLAAGALSDALQPWVGQESLRYSLLAMCPGYAWAAWHLWRAGTTVARDIQASAAA
jgi:MFS family permease